MRVSWHLLLAPLRNPGEVVLGWAGGTVLVTVADLATYALASGGLAVPSATASAMCVAIGVGPLAFAFVAWDRAITRTSVARVGVFSSLDPLLSTTFLAVLLGEPMTAAAAADLVLIVTAGVIAETGARH